NRAACLHAECRRHGSGGLGWLQCPVAPEPPGAAAGFAPGLWHAVLVLLAGRGAVFGEVHRDPTRVGGAESFGEVDAGAGEGVPAPLFGVRVRDDVGPSLREPLPEESAVVGGVQWREVGRGWCRERREKVV